MKTFILLLILLSAYVCYGSDKIRLSEINTLTLYANHKTNGRRSAGVPQLECVGGSANCDRKYIPNVVQCTNSGSDGYDVQWTCKAELEANLKFGTIDVNCEGYDFPNDQYVLKGSCGLRYTLDRKGGHNENTYNKKSGYQTSKQESNSNLMILILIVAIVIVIVCWYNTKPNITPTSANCPPPPGFMPEYTAQPNYTAPPSYGSVFGDNKYATHGAANNGPGFWTGLGAGGLAGYLFGSNTAGTRQRFYEPSNSYPNTETRYTNDHYQTRSRSTTPEYRTASGYGGTSRR